MSFFPVAVGAVGGSGTRAISQVLQSCGYFFGDVQNKASDTIWAVFLLTGEHLWAIPDAEFEERLQYLIAALSNQPRGALSQNRLNDFLDAVPETSLSRNWKAVVQESISKRLFEGPRNAGPWGWKSPSTHFFAERLLTARSDLKYVHVIRDPFDLALSGNQRQFKRWNSLVYDLSGYDDDNQRLKFWLETTDAIEALRLRFPERIRIMKFEELCTDTNRELTALFEFLDIRIDQQTFDKAADEIKMPASIGRGMQGSLVQWDRNLRARVSDWGY